MEKTQKKKTKPFESNKYKKYYNNLLKNINYFFFYNKYPKLILKISIHIYIGLCILDLIWLIIMMFVWTHGKGSSQFWKSLSIMHNFIYWFGVIEFIGKGYLIFLLFNDFKNFGNQNELLNFTYNA